MSNLSRRKFIQDTALLAGLSSVPYLFSSEKTFAEEISRGDRLRMACIGTGYMGKLNAFHFNSNCDIVALCDVDSKYGLESTLADDRIGVERKGKRLLPDTYKDYRHVLDRDDIDVVSISTPDHWHVKIAIEALQAGKHVYCEKPLSLTIEENKLIQEARKKYTKPIFMVDTWQRTQTKQFMLAAVMIRKGLLGKIKHVVCNLSPGEISGVIPEVPVPDTLDWNMWQGQVPTTSYRCSTVQEKKKAVTYTRCHDGFRWWYEYSGGRFTDWGAHHIDSAIWALDLQTKESGPVLVDGTNTKHPVPLKDGYPTLHDRYNTCESFDIPILFANGLVMNVVSSSPDGNGILFVGEKGKIHVNRQRIRGKIFDQMAPDFITEEDMKPFFFGKKVERCTYNFLRCIREGGTPICNVESHLLTMNICHLCSIAARLGRKIKWDPVNEMIVGDDQAASFITRERRKEFDIHI